MASHCPLGHEKDEAQPCSTCAGLWQDAVLHGTSLAQRPEFCICAAIMLTDLRVIRGHRHDDCIQTALKWKASPVDAIQGFVTSTGRFVDRREGMRLQKASGIESKAGYRGDSLFSEDLY